MRFRQSKIEMNMNNENEQAPLISDLDNLINRSRNSYVGNIEQQPPTEEL